MQTKNKWAILIKNKQKILFIYSFSVFFLGSITY